MASSRDLSAWRIVKAVHAATAFDGEGARITGGRWNSPGLAAVYTAESIALAALEMVVHLQNAAVLGQYVVIGCRFPRRLVTTIDAAALPPNWQATPAPAMLRQIGDAWLADLTTAVLSVPSAVIEQERNFILNPAHPDFPALTIDVPRPFAFDARLA